MKIQDNVQEDRDFIFRNYIVCLIDILGQSEQLKSWPPLPTSEQELESFKFAVTKTLGMIEWLTNGFRKYFDEFLDESIPMSLPVPQGIDSDCVKTYRQHAVEVRKNKIAVQQFSDTLVFYAPLFPMSTRIPTLMPIIAMVHACSSMLIECLSRGIAFRGGISVGIGTHASNNSFYGPVLQEVHHLESKIAQYPRIVFRKNLLASLHTHVQNTLLPNEKQLFLSEEAVLDEWIIKDAEGWGYIDFIGKGIQKIVRKCDSDFMKGMKQRILDVYTFVCNEEDRFEVSNLKANEQYKTLHERDKTLREYMDKRLDNRELKESRICREVSVMKKKGYHEEELVEISRKLNLPLSEVNRLSL